MADLYWQTSWPMDHRPWIAPELYAPPSFEAYSQNRDPTMEAILSCREHLPGLVRPKHAGRESVRAVTFARFADAETARCMCVMMTRWSSASVS